MCLSTFPAEPDFENFIVVFVKDYADGVGQNGGAAQKYISAIHTMQYGGPPAAAMQASQLRQFIQDFYARSARSRFSVDVDTGAMVDYARTSGAGGQGSRGTNAVPVGTRNNGQRLAPPPPGRGGVGATAAATATATATATARRAPPPPATAAASRGAPPPPPAPAKIASANTAVAMYDVSS